MESQAYVNKKSMRLGFSFQIDMKEEQWVRLNARCKRPKRPFANHLKPNNTTDKISRQKQQLGPSKRNVT